MPAFLLIFRIIYNLALFLRRFSCYDSGEYHSQGGLSHARICHYDRQLLRPDRPHGQGAGADRGAPDRPHRWARLPQPAGRQRHQLRGFLRQDPRRRAGHHLRRQRRPVSGGHAPHSGCRQGHRQHQLLQRPLHHLPKCVHRRPRHEGGVSRCQHLCGGLSLRLSGPGPAALSDRPEEARGPLRSGAGAVGGGQQAPHRPLVHRGRPELPEDGRPSQRRRRVLRLHALHQARHAHLRRGQAGPRQQSPRPQGQPEGPHRQDRRAGHRAQ